MLVKCPHCMILVTPVFAAYDYICPICGSVLDVDDEKEECTTQN